MAYTAQPAGFLADTVQKIYDYANEPSDNPKWTTDKLFPLIRGAYGRIMQDVNGIGQNPIVVRFDVTVTATDRTYLLPPNVGQVLMIGKVDTVTGNFFEQVIPRSRLNAYGSGVSLEGPTIRFEPNWGIGETLRVLYIPNGDFSIHLGTFTQNATGVSTTAFPLTLSPSEGYFDRRPNAPLGSIVRLLSAVSAAGVASTPTGYDYFPIQERPVSGYTSTSHIVTVPVAFDFDPSSASVMSGTDPAVITYEIVPFMGDLFQEALAFDVAGRIAGIEKRPLDKKDCIFNALEQKRQIRTSLGHYNARSGNILHDDSYSRSPWGWGIGVR